MRLTALFNSDQSLILLGLMVIGFSLSIILPWMKKASATSVISATILIVFIFQMIFTMELFSRIPFLSGISSASSTVIVQDLGFFPRRIIDDMAIHQFLTSTFLHMDFMHVGFNFLGLFILGTQLEQRIGWKRFLVIYYGSGIIAGAVVLAISPFDILGHSMRTVSLGASGCIFGLLGGFWYLYPREEIFFPLILIRKWPVSLIVLVYGGISALFILLGSDDNVSHIAHFAGLVGAFPIAFLVKKRSEEGEDEDEMEQLSEDRLKKFADTKKKKELMKRVMEADEKDVRDAWLEKFFEEVQCPKCKNIGLNFEGKDSVCPKCGKRIRP